MSVIYTPTGSAREYADLALNLYHGCQHGCIYCYAPSATFKKRNEFHDHVRPKDNIIKRLKAEVSKKKPNGTPVLMSFTCDPYHPIEESEKITREAIKILNNNGFPVCILTKGGTLAMRDFDLLSKFPGNKFGVSLTLYDSADSITWEPDASLPFVRINNLMEAHKAGIWTWVSIEPIINIEQSIELIRLTHKVSEFYGIGKLNYHKHQKSINWKDALESIECVLDSYGKERLIHSTLEECRD